MMTMKRGSLNDPAFSCILQDPAGTCGSDTTDPRDDLCRARARWIRHDPPSAYVARGLWKL